MSLQGIFDPMVKAYFERKYAESGGSGGGSGGGCRVLHFGGASNREFPSITIEDWGGTFYRIADFIEKDELNNSLLVHIWNETATVRTFSEEDESLMVVDEGGMKVNALLFDGVPLLASIAGAEDFMGIPTGFYAHDGVISSSENHTGATIRIENYLALGPVEITDIAGPT